MAELSDLVQAGEASIAQIVEALDEIDFNAMASDMSDKKVGVRRKKGIIREIADITRGLYTFELAIREGTRNPDAILSGYETFLLNYDVKGKDMKPDYVATFARRLGRHRGTLKRYAEPSSNTQDYFRTKKQETRLDQVRREFNALRGIYDPNNFGQVVDALNTAYHAPGLTKAARDNFGPRWFNAGEEVSKIKRGLTTLDELKDKSPTSVRTIQEAAVILHYRLTVIGPK